MESQKRGRGRPKGPGKDDSKELAKIANMLVANPDILPTTAFKKIVSWPDAAYIHRIQAKWKIQKEALLLKAEQRKSDRLASESRMHSSLASTSNNLANWKALAYGSSTAGQLRALRMTVDSPTIRALKKLENDPVQRALKKLYDSPGMRMIRELESGPLAQIMREQQIAMKHFEALGLPPRFTDLG